MKIDTKSGEQVCVIQHPGGRHKQISWSDKNRIDSAHTQDLQSSKILYDADTEEGSSGSPVFNMAWDLIAIHHKYRKDVDKNEGVRIKDIIVDLVKNYSSMNPILKGYIQAALVDASLPPDSKSVLQMDKLVKPGFFESEGLNVEELFSGLKKLNSEGSTDFIDLASWNIRWLSSEQDTNYVRMSDYVHSMGIDLWILYDISEFQLSKLAAVLYDGSITTGISLWEMEIIRIKTRMYSTTETKLNVKSMLFRLCPVLGRRRWNLLR